MPTPDELLEQNRKWAARIRERDPALFDSLAEGQSPDYLWIGCSDSRVPPSQIVDAKPGDLFVHRNIANRIGHEDLNGLSVLQYAVEVLKVSHVVVCGHYRCGGVEAAMERADHGLLDRWLRPLKHLYRRHEADLQTREDEVDRWDRLCELNVIDQVHRLARSTSVQRVWKQGHGLTIHGWIYELAEGRVHDLEVDISSPDQVADVYRTASQESSADPST